MSRSRNTSKGKKRHRKNGRHGGCGCSYCLSNFTAAVRRQVAKSAPEASREPSGKPQAALSGRRAKFHHPIDCEAS